MQKGVTHLGKLAVLEALALPRWQQKQLVLRLGVRWLRRGWQYDSLLLLLIIIIFFRRVYFAAGLVTRVLILLTQQRCHAERRVQGLDYL